AFSFDSLDDRKLYIRVFSTPLGSIDEMAIDNLDNLYCSSSEKVFNTDRIGELEGFDLSQINTYSPAYAEGLITLYPDNISVPIHPNQNTVRSYIP
ncbi:unnamed protein product, partial [marine sediment metagenome]